MEQCYQQSTDNRQQPADDRQRKPKKRDEMGYSDNGFARFEKKNKNRNPQGPAPSGGAKGSRTKPSREERGYTSKRGPMRKDDWKQFFQHDNDLRGPEPDFSEEGWARRKPKKR